MMIKSILFLRKHLWNEKGRKNSENFVFVTEKNMPGSENASNSNQWMQIKLRAEFYYLIWARLFNCAMAIISLVTDLSVGQLLGLIQ